MAKRPPRVGRPSWLTGFWSYRHLIWQLAKREVVGRYRGSALGLVWSFFNPLFMLAVYTFVFSVVFKARWGPAGGATTDFALFLFSGLIVYSLFAELVNRSPTLIVGNVNYVKRVVFPLEILPVVAMGSALFHASVSILVLIAFYFAIHRHVPLSIVLLPLVLLPLVLMTLGVAWTLAALGVYVRDVAQTTGILTTALLFLSPVFYPASAVPEALRGYVFLNPLAVIIEESRKVAIHGEAPDWLALGLVGLLSVGIAAAGLYAFQRSRRGFADVL